jgi:hypothetical protein
VIEVAELYSVSSERSSISQTSTKYSNTTIKFSPGRFVGGRRLLTLAIQESSSEGMSSGESSLLERMSRVAIEVGGFFELRLMMTRMPGRRKMRVREGGFAGVSRI